MALYEFECPQGHTIEVRAPMSKGPGYVECDTHQQACQRVYGIQQEHAPIQLTKAEYIEKAYRGEEPVPGISLRNIRGMVDNDVRNAQKGRRNNRDYGSTRRPR